MTMSLEQAYVFYGSYHHNQINKVIHLVCIWPILITMLVMLAQLKPLFHVVDLSVVVTVIYASYYAVVEQPGLAGTLATLLVVASFFLARELKDSNAYDPKIVWNSSVAINVSCWLAQFYGHGVHEGRSPALLTNLKQAFLMAPLFVVLEVCFMFGYRPDFQRRVEPQIEVNVREFKATQKGAKAK